MVQDALRVVTYKARICLIRDNGEARKFPTVCPPPPPSLVARDSKRLFAEHFCELAAGRGREVGGEGIVAGERVEREQQREQSTGTETRVLLHILQYIQYILLQNQLQVTAYVLVYCQASFMSVYYIPVRKYCNCLGRM